ncbi:MAG: DsbA family protein [Candidatus Pseudobacter hemicellulosilyticus]|uniref:DsbA family protein n=1 Tax=Candidatus Pseudobacter hemicellulosilyticus TaxID=3121375 RepID=A0AAJ5WWH9_9BACT|nr:MAG: DsbA family protein [Pseudobacter sp.]
MFTVYYCYDAWCGWCYGFSPVMTKLAKEYADKLQFEVLSGGMILPEKPRPVSVMAGFIKSAYKTVEERTGITFGSDYLWHIENPDLSDWFPNSEKAAIALCVFKDFYPAEQVAFAADLQYALNYEGRDLSDDEAYGHLLEKYAIPSTTFYERLHSEAYKEKAYYEFALCKQLQVTGFPAVFLQASDLKFYLLSRGYTDYNTLQQRVDAVLKELL